MLRLTNRHIVSLWRQFHTTENNLVYTWLECCCCCCFSCCLGTAQCRLSNRFVWWTNSDSTTPFHSVCGVGQQQTSIVMNSWQQLALKLHTCGKSSTPLLTALSYVQWTLINTLAHCPVLCTEDPHLSNCNRTRLVSTAKRYLMWHIWLCYLSGHMQVCSTFESFSFFLFLYFVW